jgi:hypothetical protein
MRERWYLIAHKLRRMPLPADNGIRVSVQRPTDRYYFLAPAPAVSILEELLLDELPDFIFPVEVPVVVPFFMFVCLVVLLVAPWPALCSLDAPGAG